MGGATSWSLSMSQVSRSLYITSGHHLWGRLASGLRQESSGRRLNSNWLCHLFGRTASSSSLTSSLPDGSVPGTNVVPGWADWPWLPTPAPHFREIYTLTACSLSYHHGPWWVPNTTKAQVFGGSTNRSLQKLARCCTNLPGV